MSTESSPSGIAFGVGSFIFEVPDADAPTLVAPGTGLSPQDYVTRVVSALGRIPSVDDINFDGSILFTFRLQAPWRDDLGTPVKHGPHGGGLPCPTVSGPPLAFTVNIPRRVQEELGEVTGCETFQVRLEFVNDFPVTFITGEGLGSGARPAGSVVVVRRFLEREFALRGISDLRFCFLGPSPFWGNFYVQPFEGAEHGLDVVLVPEARGYNSYYFRYSPAVFGSALHAYAAVIEHTRDQLALYYRLRHIDHRLLELWRGIDFEVSELTRLHKRTGPRAAAARIFDGGRRARRLALAIFEAEGDIANATRSGDSELAAVFAATLLPAFREEVTTVVKGFSLHALPRVPELVGFLRQAQTQSAQTALVLTSSVVGGVAGSALTAFVGS